MRVVVMCDIDGVLADNGHRLHYMRDKDYDKFYSYEEVIKDGIIKRGTELWLSITSDICAEIYYVTGRNEKCREATLDWLEQTMFHKTWSGKRAHLKMRKSGDYRKSPEVKVELVNEVIGETLVETWDPDNVFFFIDDDPENVKAVMEKFPFVCGLVFGVTRLNERSNNGKK